MESECVLYMLESCCNRNPFNRLITLTWPTYLLSQVRIVLDVNINNIINLSQALLAFIETSSTGEIN